MNSGARLFVFAAISLALMAAFEGCQAMRSVASTFGSRQGNGKSEPRSTTTTTTTVIRTTRTTPSDVMAPGHPVSSSSPNSNRPGRLIGTNAEEPTPAPAAPRVRTEPRHAKTKPPTHQPVSVQMQSEFPTAKLVPSKRGYVFSPFDPKGRYVDVSGYAPGSKVKDPWTGKVFVVP